VARELEERGAGTLACTLSRSVSSTSRSTLRPSVAVSAACCALRRAARATSMGQWERGGGGGGGREGQVKGLDQIWKPCSSITSQIGGRGQGTKAGAP
jgi:hypothetical protein